MKKLAAVRKALMLSQTEVAAWLGQSISTYSRIETGDITPDAGQLHVLSQGFGLSVDYLMATDVRLEDRLVDLINQAVARAKAKQKEPAT